MAEKVLFYTKILRHSAHIPPMRMAVFLILQKCAKKLEKHRLFKQKSVFCGGDKRDRTADLLNAIQALSQLSYTPIFGSLFQTAFVL